VLVNVSMYCGGGVYVYMYVRVCVRVCVRMCVRACVCMF